MRVFFEWRDPDSNRGHHVFSLPKSVSAHTSLSENTAYLCGFWPSVRLICPPRPCPYRPGCSTVAVRNRIGRTTAFGAVAHVYHVGHPSRAQNAPGLSSGFRCALMVHERCASSGRRASGSLLLPDIEVDLSTRVVRSIVTTVGTFKPLHRWDSDPSNFLVAEAIMEGAAVA